MFDDPTMIGYVFLGVAVAGVVMLIGRAVFTRRPSADDDRDEALRSMQHTTREALTTLTARLSRMEQRLTAPETTEPARATSPPPVVPAARPPEPPALPVPAPPPPTPAVPASEIALHVCTRMDAGIDACAIARELDISRAEVELLVQLHARKMPG